MQVHVSHVWLHSFNENEPARPSAHLRHRNAHACADASNQPVVQLTGSDRGDEAQQEQRQRRGRAWWLSHPPASACEASHPARPIDDAASKAGRAAWTRGSSTWSLQRRRRDSKRRCGGGQGEGVMPGCRCRQMDDPQTTRRRSVLQRACRRCY